MTDKHQAVNDAKMRKKALARWENEGGAIPSADPAQSVVYKEKEVTEENIKKLVDTFYGKVRHDPSLSPIFAAVIGDSQKQWGPHLEKMYAFWSSIMLTSGRYRGNPMKKHKDLPAFDIKLFDRWLALFAETAKELYAPEIAELYISKSHRIAESLKLGLYYNPGDFPIKQKEPA